MLIHAPTKSLVFQAADPLAIRALLPKASRTLGQTPDGNIAVRHNIETTRVLRNLGIDAPSPLCHYDWPGKYTPYNHQRIMSDVMIANHKCFNLSEMGTGKTYASLWAADYLMKQGLVKRCLVITTLSTMHTIWKQDIFDVLMHRSCVVVHGTPEKRAKALNMDVDFYITNHDGIALADVAKVVRKRKDIDLIILDEAAFFRNHKTDKYKFLAWVMERKTRLWMLTGTPTPNEPPDAWALIRMINPDAVSQFKGNFKRETMVELKGTGGAPNAQGKVFNKWAPKKGYEQVVFAAMQPAVRFLKKDCLDLPPQIGPIVVETRLTKAQLRAYTQMRDEMVLTSQSGVAITAVNAADQISKLRQVLCGAVKDPSTGLYRLIDHRFRVEDLCDTMETSAARKTIIIVPFKGIIRSLGDELRERGYAVGVLNGDVSPAHRTNIIREFKYSNQIDHLLCHPKVMAHGLNLVEADLTIFYAPIYSNDDYRQVIERNNRAGQTRTTTVIRMQAHPLERQIYRALDNRGITQDNILRLYDNIITQGTH